MPILELPSNQKQFNCKSSYLLTAIFPKEIKEDNQWVID